MANRRWALIGVAAIVAGLAAPAFAQTEIRITWYNDGNEGEVMRDLLDRFEAENPDISVLLDTVAYQAIVESLPVQLAAGEGPDMARVTDLGGLSRYYMDLTPHISDPAYWEENFGPFLQWLRLPGDDAAIHGFMTQLTITGPYANKTLFEQAGVDLPGEGATWDDWAAAANQVAEALEIPIPIAMDRSGHRFSGPAISMGWRAEVMHGDFSQDAEGWPAVVDDGFKAMAERINDWHQDGTMALELWGSVSGTTYLGANKEFANADVAMYMSGSWQISQFADTIGDAFDWWAVPNPCGPEACTGMPGGAALVALADSEHPEEVGRLMDYLSQEDVLAEFYGRTLFIPGHIGLSQKGVDFQTDNALAKHALEVFASQVGVLSPVAFDLQGFVYNRIIFNAVISRLGQTIVGEMTLDEAYERIEADVAQQISERVREE